ncbi:hypothetical protein [Dermatobacter hominis]|uniref:hypothetical protein n=1 Tax=Dermatobacter hominis TaxID=2884263 RepID=UPI001D114898|nr:hypothetical protein [Dermatobacter hominis]UDY37153.1 hypothetical protein LH044_06340 [Dermatobacter hominis]
MSPRPRPAPAGHPRTRRAAPVVALVAVVALAVLGSLAAEPARAQEGLGAADRGVDVDLQGVDPSTTTIPDGSATGRPDASNAEPSGQVAYVTADGRVWIGQGDAAPVEVAQGAAIGRGGQSAVAIAPTADLVAFVRSDGSLVTVPIDGGPPTVLATDAVTSSLGRDPSLAWDATGTTIAYLAVGTQDMAAPRSAARPPLQDPNSFPAPLPTGVLGNVVKIVSRAGEAVTRLGDPSLRSYVGITWSPADDLLVLESVIPGTTQRYTLVAATSGTETPTYFSADDPAFAPDGRFIVAVGPAKGRRELVRISTDTLDRTTLVTDDTICAPAVSPDGTRIVYGAGRDCSRLMLISSKGGKALDITPAGTPDTATFGVAPPGWTTEGRWITLAPCRRDAGRVECDGTITFLNPDSGRTRPGPDASTVAPLVRPLVQDVYLDVDLRGPIEFNHSFVLDPTVQGQLTDTEGDGGRLKGRLVDGGAVMEVDLRSSGGESVSGQITITDPESGVDRTFMVLGRPTVLGVRVFSISGIWISTADLPWATGRFDMAVRRR